MDASMIIYDIGNSSAYPSPRSGFLSGANICMDVLLGLVCVLLGYLLYKIRENDYNKKSQRITRKLGRFTYEKGT